MRKKISAILAAAAIAVPAVSAQSEQAPVNYLPEKGDFAIGVDLVPLLRTIGGAFNSSETPVGGTPFNYEQMYLKPSVSFQGKYMLTDNWGLRANLGFTYASTTNRRYTSDDLELYLNPLSEAKVVDAESVKSYGGSLLFGAEYRVGQRRVQGVFGFGVLLGCSGYDVDYTYGNAITELNQHPSSAFNPTPATAIPAGYRVTSANADGPSFSCGVYGSAGIEWFVAPKISLGAEVDLYLNTTFAANGVVKSEGYNQAYMRIDHHTDLFMPGNRTFTFGTDNIGGSLYVTYYF